MMNRKTTSIITVYPISKSYLTFITRAPESIGKPVKLTSL